MPTLGSSLDFSKYEGRNFRGHQLGTAPASPVTGQVYYNTADNTLYWWDGTAWQSAKGGGGAASPDATTTTKGIVQLAGDLAGTASSPQIAPGVITDADVNAANKDGVVGTASMRTLGAGAQQAMPGNRTLDAVTAPAADLSLNSRKIVNLADPTGAQDGATKNYVDLAAQGLDTKASVRAASTANIAALTGTPTIDGIVLAAGDRFLVKDQTTASQNGIYVVAAGAWSRATDADAWLELVSAYAWVEQGSVQGDTGWLCTVDQGGTLNTTAVTWAQFSGAGQITAGAGLTKTGNSLDVGAAAGITVLADTVGVATAGVTNAMLAGAIDLTAKVTGALPLANGGTGQTAAKAARETGLTAAGYYTTATHGAGTSVVVTQATHGLRAAQGLIVQVQDVASGAVELPDVAVAANGDVTVTYGAAVTANAKRITVVG